MSDKESVTVFFTVRFRARVVGEELESTQGRQAVSTFHTHFLLCVACHLQCVAPQGTCHTARPTSVARLWRAHTSTHTHTHALIYCNAITQRKVDAHLIQIHCLYLLENKKQLLKFMHRVKSLIVSH